MKSTLREYRRLVDDLTTLPEENALALSKSHGESLHLNSNLFQAGSSQPYILPDPRIIDHPLQQTPLIPSTRNLQADLLVKHSKTYPKVLAFENPQSIAESLLNPSGSPILEDITR